MLTLSKSSKREKGLTQNPARERKDVLKIQQERERTYSKTSKREKGQLAIALKEAARENITEYDAIRERERECVRDCTRTSEFSFL